MTVFRSYAKADKTRAPYTPPPPAPASSGPPPPPTPATPELAVLPPSPGKAIQELTRQLKTCTEEKQDMLARMSKLTRELEQNKQQVVELRRRREEAFMAVKERDEQISLLEQQLAGLQVQLRSSANAQKRLSAEIARLRHQLKNEESDWD